MISLSKFPLALVFETVREYWTYPKINPQRGDEVKRWCERTKKKKKMMMNTEQLVLS